MYMREGVMMIYIVVPRLGEILKERNMTQNQLAELTGIPQGTISKFDKNERHQDVHLVTISKALNISIEELYHIEETDLPRDKIRKVRHHGSTHRDQIYLFDNE